MFLRRGVMISRVGWGLRRLTSKALVYSEEVSEAKTAGSPIVALESTIITHGMPYPQNLETALAVENIIREKGAVPATVAILKGQLSVGLSREQIEYLARAKGVVKASRRDLAPIVAAGLDGATTVAGTLAAAELADIPIFVTGGIGGVHREGEKTLDVSADLTELGRSRVAVVCSGVKSILDIGKTLEYLETQGVCVCAFGDSDEFPAFYTRHSGHRAPHRAASPAHAARMLSAARALQLESGTVFAVPVPEEYAMDESVIDEAISFALKEANRKGIQGKEVTPFILAAVSEVTGGKSLASNIALIKNNAKVGADIAVEFIKLKNVDNSANSFNIGFSRGAENSGSSRSFHTSCKTRGSAAPPGGPAARGPVLVVGGANVDRTYRVAEDRIQWSSISIRIGEENLKKKQYEQGLFDVGSGEICAAYSPLSDSEVLSHPHYFYPFIPDPGILSALFEPPPNIIYLSDGQEYYLAICKDIQQCPVRIFHRGLLETHINLSYYGVNPNGVRAMAMALENNSYVTYLNLTDNWLDFDACFHLGQMLEKNSTLAELIMYGCRIGSSGTRGLCRGLTKNKTLRLLDLGSNQIGDEGLRHLSDVILLMSDIRELNLSHNEITGKGCKPLAESLEIQNKLTYLNLSHNNLYSFPSGLCAVLQLLGTNPEFEYLNLSWNSLRGQEVACAVKSVFNSKLLRHVNLSNNKLNGRDIVTLTGLFAKPKRMMFFDLSFNPLSLADALLIIRKFKSSKIQTLHLEGVSVDKQFLDELTITLEKRKDAIVTYGYVQGDFKPKGPDAREIVLNRIEFIGKKNKYRQMDIAVVVLKLLKDKFSSIGTKELSDTIRVYGVFLDEDLVNTVQVLWPGEPTEKGGKTICLKALAEYIKRKWPERQLLPTPPPEVGLVPVNPKRRNERKERKVRF